MATIPFGIFLEIVSNPKVQEIATKLYSATYSRIFKNEEIGLNQSTIDIKPLSRDQQIISDKLKTIEKRLSGMPNDTEMAIAFSSLQAELRIGQKRLWITISVFAIINMLLLLLIYFSVRSKIG